jgi:hypothetical protein
MTQDFADALGSEWLRDDALFHAALISLCGLGFIHGVMIETDPLFLYEMHRHRMPYDAAMRDVMNTLDFSKISLPGGAARPYHFQVLINPFYIDQKGVSVNTMYRSKIDPNDEAGPRTILILIPPQLIRAEEHRGRRAGGAKE